MTKESIPKKILRQPDEFVLFTERCTKWIIENWKISILFVVMGAAAFSVSYIYAEKKAEKEKDGFVQFYKGLSKYTEKGANGDNTESVNIFKDIIKNFEKGKAVLYSENYLGHIAYNNGKFDEAISHYKNVLDHSGKKDIANIVASEGLAYSYIALSKYNEGLAVLKEIIANDNAISKRDIYIQMADVYIALNDKESAKKVLNDVVKDFADNPENSIIQDKITALEAEGAKK